MSNKKEKPKSDLNIEPLSYPASEDIYNNQKEEENIDSENPKRNKTANEDDEGIDSPEHEQREEKSGRDLDVPGADLDDELEDNGSEDEENNSYSVGGDRHEDLEEDQGD